MRVTRTLTAGLALAGLVTTVAVADPHHHADGFRTAVKPYAKGVPGSGWVTEPIISADDKVPETGCLVSIGYPKFKGGLGGYARYIAICPPGTKGAAISGSDAPLKKYSKVLHFDASKGMRVR